MWTEGSTYGAGERPVKGRLLFYTSYGTCLFIQMLLEICQEFYTLYIIGFSYQVFLRWIIQLVYVLIDTITIVYYYLDPLVFIWIVGFSQLINQSINQLIGWVLLFHGEWVSILHSMNNVTKNTSCFNIYVLAEIYLNSHNLLFWHHG